MSLESLFVGCDSHSMEMVKSAVDHINPSHITVIAVDHPLLSLPKQIQWTLDKCIMKINMSSCLVDSILKWQPSKCLVSSWALVAKQRLFALQAVHYTGRGWFIPWGKSSNSIMAGSSSDCSQFLYCAGVLDSQLCCLQLVRSLREAHLTMYFQAIKQILPWFFALDHTN